MNPYLVAWFNENFYVCADCGALVAMALVEAHQAQPHVQLA